MDRLTPEDRAREVASKVREECGGFLRWPGTDEIAAAIRAAVAARDVEWRDALMLWSGGSGLTMKDEFSGPLRKLMEEKNG